MDQQELIEALREHDPVAIEELVHAYGERLLRSACLLCGNETDAQDLVQETFVQALGAAKRFRNQSGLYTWLHAILLNLTRHYRRSRQRVIYDGALAEQSLAAHEAEVGRSDLDLARSALSDVLAQLSPAHREVLVLRYFEEMKIHQIASLLGLSKGTVKSRLHYALAELQKLMPKEMNLFSERGTDEIEADVHGLNELKGLNR